MAMLTSFCDRLEDHFDVIFKVRHHMSDKYFYSCILNFFQGYIPGLLKMYLRSELCIFDKKYFFFEVFLQLVCC